MEKKKLLEVIVDNKESIVKKGLMVLGSIAALLIAAKVFTGAEEAIEENEENEEEPQDVDFSEESEEE